MKLISIRIVGKGISGWFSDELKFGDHITHLWGPNGCGKTPIVQSVAFCLGYPCVFREDIYKHCHYAILKVEANNDVFKIKRKIESNLEIEVIESDGSSQTFFNEDEYSDYLFSVLGLERPNIVSTGNKITKPYLATLLPIIYLDQDDGYRKHYYSKSNFIKDQYEEMIRVLFSLPAKNSFNKKKKKLEEKDKLDLLDREVNNKFKRLEAQKSIVESVNKTSQEIHDEIVIFETQLDDLKNSFSTHDESLNALDKIISSHRKAINKIDSEVEDLKNRNRGIDKIISEIKTEIETLNLNEEARRVFLNSGEICGSSNCMLFSKSSDSYSKNLLYLKDQIKDLNINSKSDDDKIVELIERKKVIENLISEIVDERNEAINKSGAYVLVDTISEIKNTLFELQSDYEKIDILEKCESQYFDALRRRNITLDNYNSLSSDRVSIPNIIKLKSRLKECLIKWLTSIRTKNISLDIKWKNDFIPIFGTETIEQIKGSTRARAVIAYHAALMEVLLEQEGNNINFVIFDTPKQHEIHDDDLDNFMSDIKKLCSKHSLQFIFSTTEYKYFGDEKDEKWVPKYPGLEQNMFLTTKGE
ncbi:TPA: hypothetical protein N2696_002787 [Vibrio parahaemolyticus]|uniref:AAA family ATPase n=1 Tax=Vibrio parahaemolyticus TaxID=670 RepID=UPI0011244F0E|nr:hypothetical protein [Vibrio parahaemolyticus]TOI27887.1 hypothetical protein CGI64_12645 [Vibrio parahaemolyticus]HCE3267270.1 hypothetical protein [Vibrio parahaemolyticus]HCM0393672.1 hypothetical protein [Vibrio parahaemolyticus]HCM0424970.1 hypothetical protein [Vibrio parahaemolyticus]HCM0494426.1 hypothetical protein [Vibrio parahaemolyticus]